MAHRGHNNIFVEVLGLAQSMKHWLLHHITTHRVIMDSISHITFLKEIFSPIWSRTGMKKGRLVVSQRSMVLDS